MQLTEESKTRILGEVALMVATGNLRPIQPTEATDLAEGDDQPDTPDTLTDQSLQKAQPFVDDWLAQIKDLMGRSNSLEDVRDSLFELYGEMSGDRMAAAMGEAMTLAEVAGRYEVLQEGNAADLSEPVDFARLKMAGNTKQLKQCKKGYSCGFTCISISRKCRAVMIGQSADYANWLSAYVRNKVELSPFHQQNARDMGFISPNPHTKPVSAAFTGINKATKKQKAQIEAAIAAIDAVHTDGALTPIPINIINAKKTNGVFSFRDGDGTDAVTPVKIDISKQGTTPALTFAHEAGHFIDSQVLREAVARDRFGSQALHSPELKAWAQAAIDSEAVRGLVKMRDGDNKFIENGKTYSVDKKYLRYLLTPHELFARSYAQYIAVKSKNPTMLSELKGQQDKIYQGQWKDDDFKPIAAAMDNLFRSKGWLNEPKP